MGSLSTNQVCDIKLSTQFIDLTSSTHAYMGPVVQKFIIPQELSTSAFIHYSSLKYMFTIFSFILISVPFATESTRHCGVWMPERHHSNFQVKDVCVHSKKKSHIHNNLVVIAH